MAKEPILKKSGNPGPKRDNTLLYVGAALVMVGGVALAFMPKKEEPEDTETGIQPDPDPDPEDEDPYNPNPEPEDPVRPGPDPQIDPVEPDKVELPNFSLDFTKSGLTEIKQGGAIDYRINLTNHGEQLQNYRLNLVISSGGKVVDRSEVASGTISANSLKITSVEYSTSGLKVGTFYDVRAEVWSGDGKFVIDVVLGTTFQVLSPGNATIELVRVGFTAGVVPEIKRGSLLNFQPKIFSNKSRWIRIESVMPVPGVDSEVNHGKKYVYSTSPWSEFLQHRVPSSASDDINSLIVRAIDPLSGELLSEVIGTYKVVG